MSSTRLDFRYDRWCGWMLGLLGLGARFSSVTVDADSIDVKMGWAFRSKIPRTNITSATPYDGRVIGWGVHGWRGRWLVNGSSTGLVRLTVDPAVPSQVCGVPVKLRELRVSLESPDLLLD